MFSTSSGPTSNMAIMSINFDFREEEIQKNSHRVLDYYMFWWR